MMMAGGMAGFLGVKALICALILLVISFFVLAITANVKEQMLKSFGNVIVMLLWVAAVLMVAGAIYIISMCGLPGMGKCELKGMGYKGMGYKENYKHHMMR